MIIVRAPMRISFVGGGTDLPAFYTHFPGRVISTAIDKYAYAIVNRQPLTRGVSARYSSAEFVEHPAKLKNDRIREALLHFGIENHVDVATFSDVPVKTGLGSSSSFSVALMKALLISRGEEASQGEVAELAAHLEIGLVKEPIGKQDQYAAAFGGLNIFQFNADHSVDVTPVYMDYKKRAAFENHLQVFFTGLSRDASSVLSHQQENTPNKLEVLRQMANSVFEFRACLAAGNFQGLGELLHSGWEMKKTLAPGISVPAVDEMYEAVREAGAWGGKVLGAGGGGCLLVMMPPERKTAVGEAAAAVARKRNLEEFVEIPVRFAASGVEVLINHEREKQVNTV